MAKALVKIAIQHTERRVLSVTDLAMRKMAIEVLDAEDKLIACK
jgi:hypothetical protein